MTIHHPQGTVTISSWHEGKRHVSVTPKDLSLYIPFRSCDTRYPDNLIQEILSAKGIPNLCDELMRDEDRYSIEHHLVTTLFSFVHPEDFVGKRLLDFGSGCGASTMIFARHLPETMVIGVELDRQSLEIAQHRAEYYDCHNVAFFQSPSGDMLPSDIGQFDFIFLPAVYEHLLPHERVRLLDLLWHALKPGGVLFVDETPHRWFPIETHTTGLPFINYLPDRLALWYAHRFSPYNIKHDDWQTLLRKGIRGATAREIVHRIQEAGGQPVLLPFLPSGPKNNPELWYEGYVRHSTGRSRQIKRIIYILSRALYAVTGFSLVPYISFAIKKWR